ncbi:testis-expressed protein 10 homolog [Sabethes cyaneus]|uniref:testis-expressed protein 10 homolog n=1 Tax=Sabethes cyaneus TaxID=53552 RepID=UPI00237EC0EC|nr:testis-expressed protein 10 homolog [Sabethes cyaneus]
MGGNSRKFKKAEKNKIKLKGAKLPKGTNVTKTNFKVRKIVLPDQIKQRNLSDAAVLSNRSLTVKDCLAKLSHTNQTAKCDGLRGLREILLKLPIEVTEKHLSATIKAVVGTAVDLERDVRRDCFKTLGLLFAATGQENMAPFYDVLLSFLRCAMTHIQPRIQEDSLLLLDVYLQYLPGLVLQNRDKIFPQFLDMISKLRNETKPERTLTLTLNKQTTSTKWRTRVLMRLVGMLKILIDHKTGKEEKMPEPDESEPMELSEDTDPFTPKSSKNLPRPNRMKVDYVFDVNKAHYPLPSYHRYEPCPLPSLFRRSIGVTNVTFTDQLDEGRKLKAYVQMIMPILFESWLEVHPAGDRTEATGRLLSSEAHTTLDLLLDIAIQLWELVLIYGRETKNSDIADWLREQYAESFNDHILKGFPYHQSVATSNKRRLKGGSERNMMDEQCHQQNFNICYYYCCLNENFRSVRNKNYAKIINYIEQCVNNWKFRSPEVGIHLLKVLRFLLLETDCSTVNQNTRGLLKTLLEVYIQAKLPPATRNKILILFCDIILQNDHLWREYGQDIFTLWLRMLPNLLRKPAIDFNVLRALNCFGKQNNTIFLQSLEENAEDIVNNLPLITVNGEQRPNEGKEMVVNVLFWIGKRSTLEKLLNSDLGALNRETKSYFQSILRIRLTSLPVENKAE